MTNFNFLLNNLSYLSSEDLVGHPMDSTCFRSAPVPPSFRLRLHPLRMVATLLLLLCLGFGEVWGALSSPYTCTFTAGMEMSGSNCTTGDVTWTISTTTGAGSPETQFGNQNGQSCIKLGAGKKNYYSQMTLTTSAFTSYNVTSVVIYASSNNGGSKTFKVTQGATQIGTGNQSFSSTTWVSNITRNTNSGSGGDLSIEISSDATATFIHSIQVTYSTPSCTVKPTVGSTLSSVTSTVNSITATVPISAIGGCNITENGLVYSTTNSTPTVGGTGCTKVTVTACGSTAANKTVTISDLNCGTSYYVRGYATNNAGTSYTNVTTQSTSACPLYTVTLMDDKDTRTQASYGAAVTLPSRAGCAGYTFAGWTKTWVAPQSSWTTTAPTIIPAGSYIPTANENIYPVYTKVEAGSGFSSYTKVTSAPDDWSGQYLLSTGTTTATGVDISYHFSSISLTPGTTEYASYEFTLTKVGAVGYSIMAPSGDYVGWSSSGTAFVITETEPTTSTTNYLWTPATNGYISNVNTTTRKTAYNGSSDFRPYSSPSSGATYLYKRNEGGSTTYYISVPGCCTALGSINGSVKVISGTSATLQWDVLSGVDGTTPYSVSVSPSEGTSVGGISTVDGRKNCTISGLTAGTEYTFTINAFGDGSHCDKSQDVVATTPKITLGSASGTSTYIEGSGSGSKQTFTVNAVGLTGNLTVTAPVNFAVCATESGSYTSSITLTPTSGAVSTTVYFQLVAGKTAASSPYAGNITVSGGSATEQTVAVYGTVSVSCEDPTITVQPAVSASYNMNVIATPLSVTATRNGTGPVLTYQWYSNTANSKTTPEPTLIDDATSASYTPLTTATGTKYYFCEVSSGACAVTSNISAITVNTPTITVSETSRAFGDRAKDGSYEMTFTVSGSNLAKDAGISLALGGTNAGMFSIDKTSVAQTSVGVVSETTITVTYYPTANGSHSATITISSTGVANKTVTLSGTSKNAATVTLHVAGSTSSISPELPKETWLEGDSYTLPSGAAECPEMGLYGWYTSDYEHATTAPSGANFSSPGANKSLAAGDNHFYAVYATVTPDAADTYTKITTTGELVTGDYLIVGDYASSMRYAMKNSIYNTSYFGETSVTISDNKINSNPGTDYIWRITRSNTNVTIKNGSDYAAVSSGSAVLSATVENYTFSVTDGVWALTSGSYLLGYGYNFGARSSADKNIYLFKRDPSIAGPYTTTPSCTTHSLSTAVTPISTGTAEAAKTVVGEGKTTTVTATPSDHFVFSYWTISGTGSTMSNTTDGKSTDNPVTVTMGTDDATITAHFTEKEKCTVVFMNNGATESSTTYWLGEHPIAPTLTDGVSNDACDETSDTHYGWTQTTWSNTLEQAAIDAKTAADVKVYAKDATLPAITAGDDGTTITYHAVWAKGSGGTTTISIDGDGLQAVVSSISSGYHSKDFTVGGYTFNGSQVTKCTDPGTAHDWFQLKKNNEKITIPTLPGRITNISSTAIRTATSGNVNTGVYFNSSATTSDAIASETLSSATSFSLDVTGNHTSGYLLFGAATCINQLSVTYSTVSYSKYLTTCCDKNVTLATNSPSHGTITFSPSGTISTCGADAATRQTTITVTPNTGYYLSSWSTSGVTPASLSTDIAYGSVSNSGAQATTVTFNQNTTTGTYTANATFSPIPVSSLTLHAIKKDNTSATIFEETSNNVALSLYPTEGKTASPADLLGHTVKIEFGAVLPANALNKGYTWSATVNGAAVGWSSNDLATNAVLEFNKSSGKVVAKAAGTAEIIITADDGSGITAKVTITVANVALSSLNVAKSSTTLYVGESEQIAVTYDPVNTTTKGYTTGSYTYVTIGRSRDKITLTGKAVTPGEPERVTLTSSDAGAKTATIDVTVKPLPKVTFVDNLQGKTDFSNWGSDGVVSSTVTDGVVTHTKPTPSHTDISDPGASYNACERSHLHLVGWIESTWADAHPSATHEQIVGANVSNGAGTFLEAGADLNVETYNGNTYYAVWSIIE